MNSKMIFAGIWAEINLDNIAHNVRIVKKAINKNTILSAVIKADGYGHGAINIAQTLINNGVDRFAVATLAEAMEIKNANFDIPILILSYTSNKSLEEVVRKNFIQTIFILEQAQILSKIAKKYNKTVKIHLKIDTGMNRIGFIPNEDSIKAIKEIKALENIEIEGIYTHFALSFIEDKSFTHNQVKKFKSFLKQLEESNIHIPIKHVSNSASIYEFPQYNFNMVRVGSFLFGLPHKHDFNYKKLNIKPSLTLKSTISNVKTVKKGSGISYGYEYITNKKTKVATIPAGYTDGLTRLGSSKIKGIVNNKLINQIGIICMDQCMFDITNVSNVNVGDEIILLGSHKNISITADDKANILGTSNCEIVCSIGRRVPRVYIKDNKTKKIVNYLLQDK